MFALAPSQCVVDVVAGLRNQVASIVAGVLDLAIVSADKGDTTEQRGVAVYDAQGYADVCVIAGRRVAVGGADKPDAGFVDQGRT